MRQPQCRGMIDLSDAIGLLDCKFLGENCPAGPAAPEPRQCGPDLTDDSLPPLRIPVTWGEKLLETRCNPS